MAKRWQKGVRNLFPVAIGDTALAGRAGQGEMQKRFLTPFCHTQGEMQKRFLTPFCHTTFLPHMRPHGAVYVD